MSTLSDGGRDRHTVGYLRRGLGNFQSRFLVHIEQLRVGSQLLQRGAVGKYAVLILSQPVGRLTEKYVAGVGDTSADGQVSMA